MRVISSSLLKLASRRLPITGMQQKRAVTHVNSCDGGVSGHVPNIVRVELDGPVRSRQCQHRSSYFFPQLSFELAPPCTISTLLVFLLLLFFLLESQHTHSQRRCTTFTDSKTDIVSPWGTFYNTNAFLVVVVVVAGFFCYRSNYRSRSIQAKFLRSFARKDSVCFFGPDSRDEIYVMNCRALIISLSRSSPM